MMGGATPGIKETWNKWHDWILIVIRLCIARSFYTRLCGTNIANIQ
jgi:hypothetical protein